MIGGIELHRSLKVLGLSERQKPWRTLEERRDVLWFSCEESPCLIGSRELRAAAGTSRGLLE